jgi:beta-fructofuranosidase
VAAEDETIRHEEIKEVQCIATSNDTELRTWHKLPTPVIAHPPEGMKVTGFRDPFSWKEGDTWYMGIGSGLNGVGGMVLLYRSVDARHWEYLHPLAQGTWNGETSSNPVPSGEMWECPDFFPLGPKHVLLYSTEGKTMWQVGTFDRDELRFHSERSGLLDHGAYYAPKSMLDVNGRRILWAWIQETRSREEIASAGWAGCMSLPRVLTLGIDNELCIQVAAELDTLLKNTVEISGTYGFDALIRALDRIALRGRTGHLRFRFEAGEKAFELRLQIGDGDEDPSLLDIKYSGNSHDYAALSIGKQSLLLSPDASHHSDVVIWIDGSVLEVVVDRKHAITLRSYIRPSLSEPIRLKWSGAPEPLLSLSASEVSPISSDRLTS